MSFLKRLAERLADLPPCATRFTHPEACLMDCSCKEAALGHWLISPLAGYAIHTSGGVFDGPPMQGGGMGRLAALPRKGGDYATRYRQRQNTVPLDLFSSSSRKCSEMCEHRSLAGEMGRSPEGGDVERRGSGLSTIQSRGGAGGTAPPSALPGISPAMGEITLAATASDRITRSSTCFPARRASPRRCVNMVARKGGEQPAEASAATGSTSIDSITLATVLRWV